MNMEASKVAERFKKTKEKIRTAIVNKGIEVPENATLADMARAIDEIKVSKTNKKRERE
jgi:hypothetical protein